MKWQTKRGARSEESCKLFFEAPFRAGVKTYRKWYSSAEHISCPCSIVDACLIHNYQDVYVKCVTHRRIVNPFYRPTDRNAEYPHHLLGITVGRCIKHVEFIDREM